MPRWEAQWGAGAAPAMQLNKRTLFYLKCAQEWRCWVQEGARQSQMSEFFVLIDRASLNPLSSIDFKLVVSSFDSDQFFVWSIEKTLRRFSPAPHVCSLKGSRLLSRQLRPALSFALSSTLTSYIVFSLKGHRLWLLSTMAPLSFGPVSPVLLYDCSFEDNSLLPTLWLFFLRL